MKVDYQAQINSKISNQYELFKQTIPSQLGLQLQGVHHLKIKSLQILQNNDSIMVYQESKRSLSLEDQCNLLLIYKNNHFDEKFGLNKIEDQLPYRMSQTDSLSLIKDQQESNNILDSDNLVKLFDEQDNVFTNINSIDFIITSYKKQSGQLGNFQILMNKGNYSNIYYGYCFKTQENISIKIENYSWNQFIQNRFQYQIQYEIYKLYPKLFLRIELPIFVSIETSEQVQAISKHELGEMNLYYYSQQQKIHDKELFMIKKQLLNQILLLHKHNIAHRDIKPQNVVFVKGKGWILCDFEFSMKYINEICVTSIQGTKCFLPPNLQFNSCQAGVQIKQNLFYNDIYALGITNLIIKHQISSANDIQQYLEIENDTEILCLLNYQFKMNPRLIDTDNIIEYIEPFIIQQEKQLSQILDSQQIFSMLITLKYLGDINIELRNQLIELIDNNLNIERDDYLYLNLWIHEQMETYLSNFKNLIRIEVLKSVKFWRQLFKISKFKDCPILIRFMHNLGLSDIILQFGKNIMNQNYQITIHSYVIKQLFVLKEDDQIYQEYKDLTKLKDFQNITSEDQKQIAELQELLFRDCIEGKDLSYLSQHYIDEFKSLKVMAYVCGIEERINNYNTTDEKLNALINNFTQFQNDFGVDYLKVIYALELYKIAFNQIDIKDLFKFDIFMKDKMKYFCQMPIFISFQKQSIFFQYLYGQTKQIQGQKKYINMLLIYYSESQQQQKVLNIIKQCSILIYSIKKIKKLHQIISKILVLCKDYEQFQYNLYKIIFLNQIIQILEDQKCYETFQQWYRILLWLQNKFKDIINLKLGQAELGSQFQLVTMNWMKIRGRKRHDKLVNDLTIKDRRNKQFYEMNYQEKMSIEFLYQIRQYESVTQIFLRNQNLYR